jgi:hypothetical protein
MRLVNKQLRNVSQDLVNRFAKRIMVLSSKIPSEVFKLRFIETKNCVSLRVDFDKKSLTGDDNHIINEVFKTFPFDKEQNCPSDKE